MNAQEALAYIEPRLKEWRTYREDNSDVWYENKLANDYEAISALQQLIDQANAKPKTLEELGWTLMLEDTVKFVFGKGYDRIAIFKSTRSVDASGISYKELIAIAEKMKELGMTEKENK